MTSGWIAPNPDTTWPRHAGLRRWSAEHFPAGPTPIQAQAWPVVAAGQNALLIAPTGTGKTLAAFLAVLDELLCRDPSDTSATKGVSCVYVSPLKSLTADVERSLLKPLRWVADLEGLKAPQVRVGLRTGDTSVYFRQKLRAEPPDILVTTPESLSILLSQPAWAGHFEGLRTIIVDEIHSLAPTKRGADLALSLERLAALARRDPQRIGLSATCRPAELVASFLVGPGRKCTVLESSGTGQGTTNLAVESLTRADEAAYRPLVAQRLVGRLKQCLGQHQTSIVFTNTRPLTERVAYLLKEEAGPEGAEAIAAHHGSLDATLRHRVEEGLKAGQLRMVVSSTSLELGVDYQSADFVAQVGLPGSVARCLQRLGRAGHGPGRDRNGVILASGPAELAGAVVTAKAALEGRIEPVRVIENALDVLCQNLVGMACVGDHDANEVYGLIQKAWPYRNLQRADFDGCLAYLAGELAAPAGAFEPEPGAAPRWTVPRLWKERGEFGVRHRRILRWYRMNVGTIVSEESMTVQVEGHRIGQLEAAYAESLQPGDRFVLDGRVLQFNNSEGLTILAKAAGGEGFLPRWTSDRPGLSATLATELSQFVEELAERLEISKNSATQWLVDDYHMRAEDAGGLVGLVRSQMAVSEVPGGGRILVECFPESEGWAYAVHCGLHKAAAEAVGRAVAARLGRLRGRDVRLTVADLGFVVHTQAEPLGQQALVALFEPDGLEADVLEGLDNGELIARRFRRVATTGFMVLRNVEGKRTRVGGQEWVSRRLYPVVLESCPNHPLVREARRETLEDVLDVPSAMRWLLGRPKLRVRVLKQASPFTAAWVEPLGDQRAEPIQYESADDALKRLHERLFACGGVS